MFKPHLRITTRSKNDDNAGRVPRGVDLQSPDAVREYLMRRAGVSEQTIREVQSLPHEVRDALRQYWELCKIHGFDSRQGANYLREKKDIHPLFEKYADALKHKIVNRWRQR